MNQLLPTALLKLIDEFGQLPGVGARTAERYAYHILKSREAQTERLAFAINGLHAGVKQCPVTFALIDSKQTISPLYSAADRDKSTIAVVEDPLDIVAIERTGHYKGTYHVLGGAISPIDGIGPEELHFTELLERIKSDAVTELIIATNASVEGESTSLFLQRFLRDNQVEVAISRLARGLPAGIDLEYADQITLSHALEGRRVIE